MYNGRRNDTDSRRDERKDTYQEKGKEERCDLKKRRRKV